MDLTDHQRDVLIRTAIGEARGEGKGGMEAVLHVIFNRANSGSGGFSSDPAEVALQNIDGVYQFSAWNKPENGGNNPGQWTEDSKEYKAAEAALDAVLDGAPDQTRGAMFYHAKGAGTDFFKKVDKYGTVDIGGHVFYPGIPLPPQPMPARPFGDTRPTIRPTPLDETRHEQTRDTGLRGGGQSRESTRCR
jgi:spore germination cell wall hydrolase CwlJ-like protein